jgi:hypothetical protein
VGAVMNSCRPLPGYVRPRANAVERRECDAHNAGAIELLRSGRAFGEQIEVVAVAGRWPPFGREVGPMRGVSLVDGLDSAITTLVRETNARILLMAPVPELRASAARCLLRDRATQCVDTRATYEQERRLITDRMQQLASRSERITVIDPAGFLCPGTRCLVERDSVVLYSDDDHISRAAAVRFFEWWTREQSATPR